MWFSSSVPGSNINMSFRFTSPLPKELQATAWWLSPNKLRIRRYAVPVARATPAASRSQSARTRTFSENTRVAGGPEVPLPNWLSLPGALSFRRSSTHAPGNPRRAARISCCAILKLMSRIGGGGGQACRFLPGFCRWGRARAREFRDGELERAPAAQRECGEERGKHHICSLRGRIGAPPS